MQGKEFNLCREGSRNVEPHLSDESLEQGNLSTQTSKS
jgi:hypothetical protein